MFMNNVIVRYIGIPLSVRTVGDGNVIFLQLDNFSRKKSFNLTISFRILVPDL